MAWPGLEETAASSPAKNHIGAVRLFLCSFPLYSFTAISVFSSFFSLVDSILFDF